MPPSDAAGQKQDDENQQHEADASARAIAPAAAVRPRRQRSKEREDQDDNENRCERHGPLPRVLAVPRFVSDALLDLMVPDSSRHDPARLLDLGPMEALL